MLLMILSADKRQQAGVADAFDAVWFLSIAMRALRLARTQRLVARTAFLTHQEICMIEAVQNSVIQHACQEAAGHVSLRAPHLYCRWQLESTGHATARDDTLYIYNTFHPECCDVEAARC